jgi:carboxynorspermidine decarboxylase
MAKGSHVLLEGLDIGTVPTPCHVLDLGALRRNLELLNDVRQRTGCRVLLDQRCFALFGVYPMLRWYLDGVAAGSLHEARLGHEEMGGEVHLFAPAYADAELDAVLPFCTHIVFNSFGQWERFRARLAAAPKPPSPGLRFNPEYSEVEKDVYNPSPQGSRLGIRRRDLDRISLDGIEGLSLHVAFEQNAGALERVFKACEDRFGTLFDRMRWLSFGGGHHLTGEDYDVDRFCRVLGAFRQRHASPVIYLEPGEAVALEAGVLVASVLDVVQADVPVVILDTSAAAHMPDVLEMPYRPAIAGGDAPRRRSWTCRMTGLSTLPGDVMGEYSFDAPLRIGDRVVFLDMANHTMVRTSHFHGLRPPAIATWDPALQSLRVLRTFDYEDFKTRLS